MTISQLEIRHPNHQSSNKKSLTTMVCTFLFFQSMHMFFSANEVWLKSFSGANKDPLVGYVIFCVPLLISLWVMGKYFVMGCYWFVSIPVSFSHIIGHWHFPEYQKRGNAARCCCILPLSSRMIWKEKKFTRDGLGQNRTQNLVRPRQLFGGLEPTQGNFLLDPTKLIWRH